MLTKTLTAIVAILMLLVSACSKDFQLTALGPGATVLAFGDSVTYGVGAAAGEDWPALLADSTGWNIINAGISGDTAAAGKTRLQPLLDEHQPELVIIEIGGNDFLRRRPIEAVKEDLRQIIDTVQARGTQAVLIGVPEASLLAIVAGRPSDSEIYEALAEEEGVPLVSDVFSDVLSQPELVADKIHPNARGYQEMATGIHAALSRMGLVR